MVTREDIQSYIDRLDSGLRSAEEVQPGLWVIHTDEGVECVVHLSPPVVVLRVRVMEEPASAPKRADLLPAAARVQRPRAGPRLVRARG